MKTYDLYIQRTVKFTIVAVMVFLLALSLLFFSGTLKDKRGGSPPRFIGLFFIAAGGINGYFWVLRIPHRIETGADGRIAFVSLLRTVEISAREVRSVAPAGSQVGFLVVRTGHRKVVLLNQFDGFHDFLAWLKTNNPSVELRGC